MLNLADSLGQLIDTGLIIPCVAIIGGILIALVAIVFTNIKAILVGRAREVTKREMAAYVAEGSVPPDRAVEILTAGEPPPDAQA